MGPKASFSSDSSLYVQVNLEVNGHKIEYIGVRAADPYRMQVGCADFETKDFINFKEQYDQKTPFIRSVSEDMIELWHPDFDVLAYVVAPL